ncbi:MAG: hypothetical protein K6U87_09830 [Firmicutes bacterium]|nr:hypothetical protein [Bacillota bacterium]
MTGERCLLPGSEAVTVRGWRCGYCGDSWALYPEEAFDVLVTVHTALMHPGRKPQGRYRVLAVVRPPAKGGQRHAVAQA